MRKHTVEIPVCIVAFFDAAEAVIDTRENEQRLAKEIERVKYAQWWPW